MAEDKTFEERSAERKEALKRRDEALEAIGFTPALTIDSDSPLGVGFGELFGGKSLTVTTCTRCGTLVALGRVEEVPVEGGGTSRIEANIEAHINFFHDGQVPSDGE